MAALLSCPVDSVYLVATPQELADFLKAVERRAFKRAYWQVQNEETALDIVQDSMLKLAEHYGHKPPAELPLLFARILSNTTLDWFRQRKTERTVFTDALPHLGEDATEQDWEDTLANPDEATTYADPASLHGRKQTAERIDKAVQNLPLRQREAFVLRYWENLSVAEAASAMACTEGSVKVHCFRAVQSLARALSDLFKPS